MKRPTRKKTTTTKKTNATGAATSSVPVLPLPTGILAVPAGWGLMTEVRLTEPEQIIDAPMTLAKKDAKPRTNLSMRRYPTNLDDPVKLLTEHVESLGKQAPGFSVVGKHVIDFLDGAQGAGLTISYEPLPGLRVAQHHVFRIDDAIATHFVASSSEKDASRLDDTVGPIIRSFRL